MSRFRPGCCRACLAGLIVCALSFVATSAFSDSHNSTSPPIRIGVSLGLTGSYENITRLQRQAFRLWETHINQSGGLLGRKVEVIIRDDQSDPEQAKTIYRDFIENDKVDFVFGPYSSPITAAVAPIVDQYGYPMLAAGASADEIWKQGYSNVFGIYSPAARYTVGFLALLAEVGVQRIAIVAVDDVFSLGVAEGARKWAPQYSLKVVTFVVESAKTPNLTRAAEVARQSGAQALILAGHYNESVQMRTALKQISWSPVAFYATVGPAQQKYYDQLGRDADGTFSTSLWEPREDLRYPGSAAFLRAFHLAYGETPSYQAATAYAAGQILEQAIMKAGKTDRAAVREALIALDMSSIVGRYAVDRTGLQIKQFALIVQWHGKKREIVSPTDLRTAAPIFNR